MDEKNGQHSLRDLIGGLSWELQQGNSKINERLDKHEKWLEEDPGVVPFVRTAEAVLLTLKRFLLWIVGLTATVATAVVSSCAIDLQKTGSVEDRLTARLEQTEAALAESNAQLAAIEQKTSTIETKTDKLQRSATSIDRKATAAKKAALVNQITLNKVAQEVGAAAEPARKKRWYERLLP